MDDEIGPQVRLVSRLPTAGYILFSGIVCIGIAILIVTGAFYVKNLRGQRKSETDLKLVGT